MIWPVRIISPCVSVSNTEDVKEEDERGEREILASVLAVTIADDDWKES